MRRLISRVFWIVIFLILIAWLAAELARADSGLVNGGFESGSGHYPVAVFTEAGDFWFWLNPGEITTPDGWTTYHKWSNEYAQPEVKVIPKAPPYLDPPRVRSGQQALQLFSFYRIHDAGFYQRVELEPGWYLLTAWVHAWCSCYNDPHHSECDPWDYWQAWQYVGVDTSGGDNPFASSVLWSNPGHIYDVYAPIHLVFHTGGGSATVFLRSWVKWPYLHNDMYWDDVSLAQVEPLFLPSILNSSGVQNDVQISVQMDVQGVQGWTFNCTGLCTQVNTGRLNSLNVHFAQNEHEMQGCGATVKR